MLNVFYVIAVFKENLKRNSCKNTNCLITENHRQLLKHQHFLCM